MNDKAEELARDRWPEILQACGMAEAFFSGRHGPCPFCGGTDRYRWSGKYGGVWLCTMCPESSGKWSSGFAMLMKHMGYARFQQAADHVRRHCGSRAAQPGPQRRTGGASADGDSASRARNLRRMQALWDAARPITPGDPADRYLRRRVPGLEVQPLMLRLHPALAYWLPPTSAAAAPRLLGRYPALLAKAFDAPGRFVQLHKTYLTPQGEKAAVPSVKKMERGVGAKAFYVPLLPLTGDTLGLAEGIESALAAAMLHGHPVWPCLSGPSLAAVELPVHLRPQLQRIVIFADHDLPKPVPARAGQVHPQWRCAGSHYAGQAAQRLRDAGLRVLVVQPARRGEDMADQWAALQARRTA